MRVAQRNRPGLRGLWPLDFWQILAKRFFDDKSPGRESENRRVFTGDLNGGPGWT